MADARAFVGGHIFTGRRHVEALLVEDGQVITAGSRAEVSRSSGTGAAVVDLGGRTLVPGLIDAHFHLRESALQARSVDLHGARSLEEMLARVASAAAAQPEGPVLGLGWDSEAWPELRYPSQDDLDRIVPSRPVALWRVCGHVAVVNSAAVESLGLDPESSTTTGGRWGRDPGGRFNGALYESALDGLRPLGADALRQQPGSIRTALDQMARYGVTTIAPMNADGDDVGAAMALESQTPLPVRLRFYLRADSLPDTDRLRAAVSGSPHSVVGTKAMTDGSLGARTAWLSEPYHDAPGQQGWPITKSGVLAEWLTEAGRLGLQPALHAIGDRAIYRALRLLEAHRMTTVPRIEHASLAGPHLFSLLDRIRPHLVVQPSFVSSDPWLVERLGESRARWAYAFRTLRERGYSLAASSDAPFDVADPWRGIASAEQPRRPLTPEVGGPAENLDVFGAFQMYTLGGASALEEKRIGTLEPGTWADFAILDVPRLESAVAVGAGAVQSTWMSGRRTYEAGPSPTRR